MKFVCISDTHAQAKWMKHPIPDGDVLIHAGDFTHSGSTAEIVNFSKFLRSLDGKFCHKFVICGNHELSFDKNKKGGMFLNHCTYLQDESFELGNVKIYASPRTVKFHDTYDAFALDSLAEHWQTIPSDTEILISLVLYFFLFPFSFF
jgi:3',5'-cyclic AMP phosphodiesterase CpdA